MNGAGAGPGPAAGGETTRGRESGPGAAAGGPRLRVALVGEYPTAEDAIHAGGVQAVTHGLAHALARRDDVECHVVCATRNPPSTYRRVGALHVHFVPRSPLPRLATCHLHDVPRIIRLLRALRPDIVHGQGQDRHGLAAARSGFPTVITPHGVIFLETPLLLRHRLDPIGALKRTIMDGIEREVFRRARDMIVISRYLPAIYGPLLTARTHFIENPIDPEFFTLGRAPERGRLLFAGTVVPRKRVEDLVRAVALLAGAAPAGAPPGSRTATSAAAATWQASLQLRIVGPPVDPVAVDGVRREIDASRLRDRVALTGPLRQIELYEEFRRAELLVLASREETSPQVIAQAMACGLPVVSSDGGGVGHMVRDGETALLFPVGDIEACADRMRRLLDDSALRAAIAERARAEARQRFHPDAVAEQTVGVYRRAIEAQRGRSAPGA